MKKFLIRVTLFLCATTLAFAEKPTLDVGERKMIVRAEKSTGTATYQMQAIASDPDGGLIVKYDWRMGAGSSLSSESSPSFNNPPGSYRYTVKVTDDQGESMVRGVKVTVTDSEGTESAVEPVKKASAGGVNLDVGERKITVRAEKSSGIATYQLTAIASDPDGGKIVKYDWRMGPGGSISDEAAPTFNNPPGSYSYTIKVMDDQGEFMVRGVKVTVTDSEGAEAEGTPLAEEDRIVSPGGSAVSVAPTQDLELWMADPDVRISQHIYAQLSIKAQKITATLNGEVIFEKKDPEIGETIFDVDYLPLQPGTYTLTVTATGTGDKELATASRVWKKQRPAGVPPKVGINKHNTICIDGNPFFPITSWGLDERRYTEWAGTLINTAQGVDWNKKMLADWEPALDLCAANNIRMAGPSNGQYFPETDTPKYLYQAPNGKWKYRTQLDPDKMKTYIEIGKDHPGMFAWSFKDEPDLGSVNQVFTPTEVRKWTELCHELDPEHPTMINVVGYNYTRGASVDKPEYKNRRAMAYAYLFSNTDSGGKTMPEDYDPTGRDKFLVTDIMSMDYYPYERGSIWNWCNLEDCMLALDRLQTWSHSLAPVLTWIETGDVWMDTERSFKSKNPAPTPSITPHQLKNLCWLSVIHGAKGVAWFHYFGDKTIPNSAFPDENKVVAAQFLTDITDLTSVALGNPNVSRTVSHKELDGGRIDIMARESETGVLYLFTGNLREETQTVRFDVEGLTAGQTITLYGSDRTLTAQAGFFEDTFNALDINIYVVPTAK